MLGSFDVFSKKDLGLFSTLALVRPVYVQFILQHHSDSQVKVMLSGMKGCGPTQLVV